MQRLSSMPDGGGRVVRLDFKDDEGEAVIPISPVWSLFDGLGAVVNDRSDVSLTPASTVYIALGADDTAYSDGPWRILVANGEYLSSLTGTNMPVRVAASWQINDLPD